MDGSYEQNFEYNKHYFLYILFIFIYEPVRSKFFYYLLNLYSRLRQIVLSFGADIVLCAHGMFGFSKLTEAT